LNSSYTLFCALVQSGYIDNITLRDRYWWPNSGTFETFISAILTQNTKWENVQKALDKLKSCDVLSLEKIDELDIEVLQTLIKPSGFYKQKSIRIKNICRNIKESFFDFDSFRSDVSRGWLLSQKGIGAESADAILCYCCYKDEMVVDRYTHRLLNSFGLELDEYDDIKDWLVYGIESNFDDLQYEELFETYAIFHGMIVEFCKNNCSKSGVEQKELLAYIN
jgi:endonuclease-3 related protein